MFSTPQSLAATAAALSSHFIVQLPGGMCVAASSAEDQKLAHDTIRFYLEMQAELDRERDRDRLPARVPAAPPMDVVRIESAPAPSAGTLDGDTGTPMYGAGIRAPSAEPEPGPAPEAPHRDIHGNAPLGIYQQITPRTFSVAAEYYLNDIGNRVSRATMKETRFVFRLFKDLVGDRLLHTLDAGDTRLLVDALKCWPSNASRRYQFLGMSPKKIVEKGKREGWKPIATSTCQKHIDHLRAFFRWSQDETYMVRELLKGARRNAVTTTECVVKKAFEDGELSTIFDHARMREYREPHKFWVPLLGLFMGMRVNEASQLFVDDVALGDIPTICISDDREGQRLKTKSSHRILPIHPVLIELGFLDYVSDVRKLRAQHLFPGLKWGENGPGEVVSTWFNRTLLKKHCGINSKAKTLHSLRHTFCTTAELRKVRIHRIARLVGHAPTGDVTLEHYVMGADVPECLKDIKRVKYPKLNIPAYDPAQFNTYLVHVTAPTYRPKRRRTKADMEEATMGGEALSMLL